MKNILKVLIFTFLFIATCSCVSIKRHHEVRDRLLDNLMSCESSLLRSQETIGNMKNLRNACEERNKSFVKQQGC